MVKSKEVDLSFVFPCLNEKDTIKGCLEEIGAVLKKMPEVKAEVIISDNGSTDGSLEIASQYDVRVVNCAQKGYGEALKNGFKNARGKYIAFADIDGSYPLEFLPMMYEKAVKEDADMVIASRMSGTIEKGAMPWLHRYLGTPILTGIINLLFKGHLTDCNSGFRLFKKTAYEKWQTRSSGMEFASELLIKALKGKAKIIEIAAGLNRDKRLKAPHLSTWRDGMRHLLFILSEAPKFFECIGLIMFLVFSALQILAFFASPLKLGNITILNYHSQLMFIILSALGIQVWGFSMLLYLFNSKEQPYAISKYFINIPEEKLLLLLLLVIISVIYCISSIFISWARVNFQQLNLLYDLLFYVYIVTTLSSGIFSLLSIHILKRVFKR